MSIFIINFKLSSINLSYHGCHPKGNKFFMDVDLVEVITSVYEDSFTGYKILFIN